MAASSSSIKEEARTTARHSAALGQLFFDSSRRKLTRSEIGLLHVSILSLARNEILARRGQIFKENVFRNHFSKYRWYQARTGISASSLTALERDNLARLTEREHAWKKRGFKQCQGLPLTAAFDLDGDGTKEQIKLHPKQHALSINNRRVSLPLEIQRCFHIADLNFSDNRREILVLDQGPSDDYAMHFYSWANGGLIKVGVAEGDNFVGDGAGKITVAAFRGKLLHTWWHEEDYELTSQYRLKRRPRKFYRMPYYDVRDQERDDPLPESKRQRPYGLKVMIKIRLPLYASVTSPNPTRWLPPKTRVTITGCDEVKWCLVEKKDGKLGWFAIDKRQTVVGTGKSVWDVFHGLNNAD